MKYFTTVLVFLFTLLNLRLIYLHYAGMPVRKFYKVVAGVDKVDKNYFIVNKDTVLQNPYNDPDYPYLNERRNIDFEESLNTDNTVSVLWYLWYDGDIIEDRIMTPEIVTAKELAAYERSLKVYASKRVKIYSEIKHVK